MQAVRKFLIIRFSSIGDIVLTTPVIRCLQQQVPNAEIHYLTKKSFAGILTANPYITKVFSLEKDNWGELLPQLMNEGYEAIIDLHNNLRTAKVKKSLATVKSHSFNKLNIQKWIFTALKINILPAVHIVDRYLATVKGFNVVNDGKGLDYFIPEKDEVAITELPMSHQLGYIAIVIGAALQTKQLPLKKLKELCAAIPHPIVLLGGKEDAKNGEEIASVDAVKIYNACGKFNLNESADLVRKAKRIITHDTGLMHIAAAFKKPIFSIWGNTVPAFGMDAYYGNTNVAHTAFEVKGLWCRPCSKIGYKRCPLGHFNCMNKQQIPSIAAKVMG